MSEDVEIHLRAYDEASDIIAQVGSNLSATFTDIQGRTQDLVTTTDSATSQIADDYNQVNDAGQNLQNSQGDMQRSCGDSVMALNNLALSGAALSMSFMNVENRQVAVDRANLMVERSTATLQKAQEAYNNAVAQYGANSSEAQAALDKLNIAEDAHNVAIERADMSQRNLNMSMVTAGLMVIPGLFTAFASIKTILPKTTAETFTLGGALDFLSANPIVLVIAGIAALVAALVLIPGACGAVINAFLAVGNAIRTVANDIGGWFGGVIGMLNGADAKIADSAKTLKTAVESTTPSMTAAEFQTGIMMQAVQGFEDAVKSVDDTLLTSNEILATNAATLSEYKDKATAAGDEVNVIDTKIADLNKTYADSKGALDTQLMGMQAVSVFMPGVTTNIDQLKTKEAELKSQLDTTIGSLESSKTAFEAQQKAANDAISDIDSLTKKYDDMKASADTNLGAVKAAFDSAFNAGDMAKAYGIVNDFGEKYGLVFADAEKIVESFKAAQAEVPKSIEEQLIGKAQADLKAFQECATGKFTGMQEDSSASVKQLVADTNDLIAHGLVGQAQDNIKAYVTCATDKHAQLVSNIEADLAKLRKDYAAGATDLAPMIKQLEEFKLAATMGQPGVDIYAAIKLAGKTASEVAAQTETATTQITASFQGMANNAIMHAQRLQDSLVGHSVWTDMLQKMEDTTEKSVAKIHKQFQTLQAEGIAGGGFGVPETLPGSGGGKAQVVNNVTITVQGNADKATMDYAVNKVFEKLKGVVIEPTSSHASAMSKMIRQGSVF